MSAKAMLNARQEAFARGLAEGMSQRQAYMAAGYGCKGTTADENASRLLGNAKVAARVSELRK
jgi:phage terminase small subunit